MSPEEIQQIFFAECEESLAAAEAGLAACKAGTHDSDTVNAVFRGVHSIKGGAGAFGFGALQAYTHTFETLLSDVREGLVPIDPKLVDLLLRALDTLADHVEAAREGGDAPADAALIVEMEGAMAANGAGAAHVAAAEPDPEPEPASTSSSGTDDDFGIDLDSLLDDLTGGFDVSASATVAGGAVEPASWHVQVRPRAGAMRNGSEPLLMLREVASLGGRVAACDVSQVPPLDSLDIAEGYLAWTFAMPAEVSEDAVRDIFDFIGDDCAVMFGDDGAEGAVASTELDPTTDPAEVGTAATEAADGTPAEAGGASVADSVASQPAPVSPPVQTQVASAVPPPAVEPAATAAAPQATAPAGGTAPVSGAGQSIRIDLFKLDRLIDLVGELVIAQAMLVQRLEGVTINASEELSLLESLTRDIQESAMSIRAQPIGSVFSRVPRILRDLAASTGKHVKLDVFGETTELDKTVIERLGEPLTHLIRNAVDHGIETAEARIAAGKSPEGTLTLSAEHRAGRILISIADDGAGINRERVLAKAIEKGIVSADAQLSAEEIDNLIFAPGFSTAQVVSNISGRGVGMDVVRQNVKDLGGRITIESNPGKGTAFILTLPLTLAISDGMIVNVCDQTLVVPLAHVVESLRPSPDDVQGLGSSQAMLNVRGRFIPVISLREALGAQMGSEDRLAGHPEQGVLIVVDTESAGQAALLVDDIQDQRQFVIKSLATNFRPVEGVAGATILGDGRVALIVDVDGLVACALPAQDRAGHERQVA